MSQSEIDAIVEHCIKTEEGVRIATKVAAAFPSLRSTIDRRFAAGVATAIRSALGPAWVILELPVSPSDYQNEIVRVAKVAWRDRCWAALARDYVGKPKEFLYYRVRNVTGRAAAPEVRNLLNAGSGFRPGLKTRYSEWWSEKVTGMEDVMAYLARSESVQECSSDLLQVARLAEPLIDRLLADRDPA